MLTGVIMSRTHNIFSGHQPPHEPNEEYEYCPRCDADLTLQKGYSNKLPYWICLGCGEMLINPEVDSDVAWFCDNCGAMLNIQPGFRDDCGAWTCAECGFVNKIDESVLYESEDEYEENQRNPYRGLSDEDALELSFYEDVAVMEDKENVVLVRHRETGRYFIKKLLTVYNKSVYIYLKDRPIAHMPGIVAIYEGGNSLIVIEEFVDGRTVAELLEDGPIEEGDAVLIARRVCGVLHELHTLPRPIIHRDVKPQNIIVTHEGEVCLLDMNVAKWYDPDQTDDTRYMGTMFYAAPEQAGYGLTASSAKSDIYAVGMLLNVMVTGKFPKEQRAPGRIWEIVERCIKLSAEERYTDEELMQALDELL